MALLFLALTFWPPARRLWGTGTYCPRFPSDFRSISNLLAQFQSIHGTPPFNWQTLLGARIWTWRSAPKDPWRRTYGVARTTSPAGWWLWTLGRDGRIGGESGDADWIEWHPEASGPFAGDSYCLRVASGDPGDDGYPIDLESPPIPWVATLGMPGSLLPL